MPYDLEVLENKAHSLTYSCLEGERLRQSYSAEENATFVVNWAIELFGDWATWM